MAGRGGKKYRRRGCLRCQLIYNRRSILLGPTSVGLPKRAIFKGFL